MKNRILVSRASSLVLVLSLFVWMLAVPAGALSGSSNAVRMVGSSDVSIASGTFTVTDFSIPDGADSTGANAVGDVHKLTDSRFTFTCGRTSSEDVATWFNKLVSGYNDASLNGDRTTFDKAASALNFAFVGDLSLEVSTSAGTYSVKFPSVVLAQQGSTSADAKWWFGQKAGQHTKDKTGSKSILAIGSTASGQTVYASFASVGCKTIRLNALSVVPAARYTSNTVTGVAATVAELPEEGVLSQAAGFPVGYDSIINHIQGHSVWADSEGTVYDLFTHSDEVGSYGHIAAGTRSDCSLSGYKAYPVDWLHPGGIAVLGDYLFVPNETDDAGHVAVYDLRSLEVGELRRLENIDLSFSHKAGALGVTSYTDASGKQWCVLCVAWLHGSKSVYYVYRADLSGGMENATFEEVGSTKIAKDFQGFGLVTESGTNKIYLIGLYSPETESGLNYEDSICLYALDTSKWTFGSELSSKEVTCQGGNPLIFGVHFRYGAGIYVDSTGTLMITATERNSVAGSPVAVNEWK